MQPLHSPSPPEHLVDKYKTHEILDLIHEETKPPHPTGEIALNAKLVKLEYLFQELNKIGEEKKAVGITCQHIDDRVFEKLFGDGKYMYTTTYYPVLIQELIEEGIGRVEFTEGYKFTELFNHLIVHPTLITYSINSCETSRMLGVLTRKCVLFGVEFVLIMKEKQ